MTRFAPIALGRAAVLAAALLSACDPVASTGAHDATGAVFTVARGDLDVNLVENGTLVAAESQKLMFKIRGEGRITFLVPEGSEVAEGDVVCRLDTTQLEAQLAEQELQLLTAETALSTARTDLEIQVAENGANLEKARNEVDKADKELERYRDGDAPQERRKLEVELKDAETTWNRASKKFADSQELLKLKYIKQTELEDHRIEFEKATVTKEGAELAIHLFDKYTLPMTIAAKAIAARDAKLSLETTEKRAGSQLQQKQVAVTQEEKRVEQLRRAIGEKKQDLANMTLKAPCPGIVIYGDPREMWYADRIKVGGTVWEGTTMMTIPDLRLMLVKLEIHEADINKIAVGQSASVTMDTYPGLVLAAEVSKVAQIASSSNPWEQRSEVKKFDVELTIKSTPESKLKPGISAKAEIRIDRRHDALFVPLQSVFLEGGKHFCRVLDAEAPVRREVGIGLSSDRYVEILAGLNAGDRVLLYNPDLPAAPAAPAAAAPDATEATTSPPVVGAAARD